MADKQPRIPFDVLANIVDFALAVTEHSRCAGLGNEQSTEAQNKRKAAHDMLVSSIAGAIAEAREAVRQEVVVQSCSAVATKLESLAAEVRQEEAYWQSLIDEKKEQSK